ncbi:MAG: TolB family protein, partial [Anaerolineales bacterium]
DTFGTARMDPAPTISSADASRRPHPVPGSDTGTIDASIPVKKSRSKATPFIIGSIVLVVLCVALMIAAFSFNLIPGIGIAQNPTNTPSPLSASETIMVVVPSDTPQPDPPTPTPEETEIVDVRLESSPTEEIPTEPVMTATPMATPQGGGAGQILFVSDRNGRPQLFTMNADGSNLQQVTNEIDGACQPDWSPDGTRIVFVSPCRVQDVITPHTETYRGSTLFVVNADGTGRVPLVSYPGGDFDPAWSPDGEKIAFTTYRDNLSSSDLNLYLYNLADNSVTPLTNDLNADRRPAWSPDGEQIAFQRQPQGGSIQINIMQKDGTGIYIFSDPQLNNSFMPDWGVHDSIVFSRGNPFPAPITRPLSPRNAQEIQLSSDPAWDVDYSPDGYWLVFERVVFQSDGSRNHDIYLMSFGAGASAIQLTDDPARDYQPVWKPSGKNE